MRHRSQIQRESAPKAPQSGPGPVPAHLILRNRFGSGGNTRVPKSVEEALSQPGRPLDSATRGAAEARLRFDFSRVRIHSDEAAGESAQAIRANAYNAGQHIVFARGAYAPDTAFGQALLDHELQHVMQRDPDATVPAGPLELGNSDSTYEQQAEKTASTGAGTVATRTQPGGDLAPAVVARSPSNEDDPDDGRSISQIVAENVPKARSERAKLLALIHDKVAKSGITVACFVSDTEHNGKRVSGASEFRSQARKFTKDHDAIGLSGGKLVHGEDAAMEITQSLPSLTKALNKAIADLEAEVGSDKVGPAKTPAAAPAAAAATPAAPAKPAVNFPPLRTASESPPIPPLRTASESLPIPSLRTADVTPIPLASGKPGSAPAKPAAADLVAAPIQVFAVFTHGIEDLILTGWLEGKIQVKEKDKAGHEKLVDKTIYGAGWVGKNSIAEAVGPYATANPQVLLFACRTAGTTLEGKGTAIPENQQLARNLALTLHAKLRERLGEKADVSVDIWGHEVSGHTTTNDRLVEFSTRGDGTLNDPRKLLTVAQARAVQLARLKVVEAGATPADLARPKVKAVIDKLLANPVENMQSVLDPIINGPAYNSARKAALAAAAARTAAKDAKAIKDELEKASDAVSNRFKSEARAVAIREFALVGLSDTIGALSKDVAPDRAFFTDRGEPDDVADVLVTGFAELRGEFFLKVKDMADQITRALQEPEPAAKPAKTQ